jgi:hypothetical protein
MQGVPMVVVRILSATTMGIEGFSYGGRFGSALKEGSEQNPNSN